MVGTREETSMKEKFNERKFNDRSLAMIERANEIIEEYARNGYDLSVRQLHYRFVSKNIYINTPENYQALQTIVSEGRIAGLIDWDAIKDRGRVTHKLTAFDNLKVFLQRLNNDYRRSKWKNQDNYVEVMVEKQALEGVLLPVCERWEVAFTSNKGYSSTSSIYERAKYLQSQRDVEKKNVHVIYLGDHDPSGIDMSRDIEERLTLFSDGYVNVHRVALNIDQIRRLKLEENDVKIKDSRSEEYVEKFGPHCWELDAIEPNTLAMIVEHQIRSLINKSQWDKDLTDQESDQEELQNIIDKIS